MGPATTASLGDSFKEKRLFCKQECKMLECKSQGEAKQSSYCKELNAVRAVDVNTGHGIRSPGKRRSSFSGRVRKCVGVDKNNCSLSSHSDKNST